MKTFLISVFTFAIISCSSNESSVECIQSKMPVECQVALSKLHETFLEFLELNYPNQKNPDNQLQQFCADQLKSDSFPKLKFGNLKETLSIIDSGKLFNLSTTEKGYKIIWKSEFYRQALIDCRMKHETDSILKEYVESLEVVGDIQPIAFMNYLRDLETEELGKHEILWLIFEIEVFYPIIKTYVA